MREFTNELINREDRSFEIGGEVFKWRYPYWEEYADQVDKDMAELSAAEKTAETNDETLPEQMVRKGIQSYIDRIPLYLDRENDAERRWKALTKRKEDPVPPFMYRRIYEWLLEVTSGRPTEPPSPSENGQGQTVSMSTEGSS